MGRTCRKHNVKDIATFGECPECPECVKDREALNALRQFEETQRKVALWEAINSYTIACGGDPAQHAHGNTPRQTAVAEVERIVFNK